MFPTVTLFGTTVTVYSLLILAGFGAGLAFVLVRAPKAGIPREQALVLMILAGVGSFLGGKIFYMIEYLPLYFKLAATGYTFADYFREAGMVYYGGFFGCILFILLFCKILKLDFWKNLDLLLPALPLAQAFGRIGCFSAGCCWGMACPFGFELNASPFAPHGVTLLPVQLFESAACLALFFILARRTKKACPPGHVLGFYMLFYGVVRFVLEFFRGDDLRGVAVLSVSQWVSLAVIAAGICFVRFYHPKENPKPAQ